MAQISAQKVTVDLPTMLVDAKVGSLRTMEPGLEAMGYLAIPGYLEFAVVLDCPSSDPTRVQMTVRVLGAHYSPPANCSPQALAAVNHVNAALAENFAGGG